MGRQKLEDKQTKEKASRLVKEFVDKFKSRNGSIICGHSEREELFATLCPKFVQDAVEILEQILE